MSETRVRSTFARSSIAEVLLDRTAVGQPGQGVGERGDVQPLG